MEKKKPEAKGRTGGKGKEQRASQGRAGKSCEEVDGG
jgi:hypothetical protein